MLNILECPECGNGNTRQLKSTYSTVRYSNFGEVVHGHFTCQKCKTSFGYSRDSGFVNVERQPRQPTEEKE